MFYLFAIGFNELVSYFGNDIYLPALPRIMSHFNLNEVQAQLSLFIWIIGIPLFQIVFSHYHQIRKRNIILISNLLLVASCLVCFFTNDYSIFLAMRLLQSASVSALTTVGYALIYEKFGEDEGARLIGLLGSITIMCPALGPPLGSLILDISSWPFIFMALAAMGAIATVWTHTAIKKHHSINLKTCCIPKAKSAWLFYLLIFCACQILIPLVLWICESPIILMIEHHFDETTYGVVMFGIFSAYALGAFLMSQIAGKVSCLKLLNITFPAYAFFTLLIILLDHLTYKLILIGLLMFLSPILSNRLTRYIVILRIDVLEKSLGIFSFFYSIAAIIAGALSTFISFHTINAMGWIIILHISIAYIVFLFIKNHPDIQQIN